MVKVRNEESDFRRSRRARILLSIGGGILWKKVFRMNERYMSESETEQDWVESEKEGWQKSSGLVGLARDFSRGARFLGSNRG